MKGWDIEVVANVDSEQGSHQSNDKERQSKI